MTRGFAVCYYNSNHGYYAAVLNPKAITIHTPHFFSRYALRKELPIHGIDLMIHYFRNNTHFVSCIEEITNPDGSKQKLIECSSEEGIMLGLRPTETIFLAKTFITREMAKGEQVELFALYENWRKEIFQKGYLEENL
ncbi:MAG: hypothetical protein LUD02_13890 [Tannerellaceae bacterium]|nr:hypothetical protein [Tannerellaceae bacterium]MCD8265098.1 hypothetical protein [Tannerellaceae bacterium]